MAAPSNNPFLRDLGQYQVPTEAAGRRLAAGYDQQLSANELRMLAAQAAAVSRTSGVSQAQLQNAAQGASRMAADMGLDPRLGLATTQSSALFGGFYEKMGGQRAFGGMSLSQVQSLDQELRLSAALSPMANQMGAAMSLAQSGALGIAGQKILNDEGERRKFLQQVGESGPGGFVEMMGKYGVSGQTAATFLNSSANNQKAIAKYNVQDVVRGFQGQEAGAILQQDLAGGFASSLRESGMGRKQARSSADAMAKSVWSELESMSQTPEGRAILADPNKRNDYLAEHLAMKGVKMDPRQLNDAVRRSMNQVDNQAAETFGRMGGLEGVLGVNRKDALQATDEMNRQTKEVAPQLDAAVRTKRIEELKKSLRVNSPEDLERIQKLTRQAPGVADNEAHELTRLTAEEAETARAASTKHGDNSGGKGGPIKISGTLSIKTDGSAKLDGVGGVPMNE
jgi:hypothetical protein